MAVGRAINMDEKELMIRAQAGDIAARNTIIMSFYPLLVHRAKKLSPRHREDLVSVGVQYVIERFHKFDPSYNCKASTYFVPVARYAMIEWLKHREQYVEYPNDLADPWEPKEDDYEIRHCLDRIHKHYRTLLLLRYERDLTLEDCGLIFGISREGARQMEIRALNLWRMR